MQDLTNKKLGKAIRSTVNRKFSGKENIPPQSIQIEKHMQKGKPISSIKNLSYKTNRQQFPIPKESSYYSNAKHAEYVEKNLPKAESLYKAAISNHQRVQSSIKDLAGVMHQQGRTFQAVQILQQYQHEFQQDQEKFQNLVENLQRQIIPTGNTHNKKLKLKFDSYQSDKQISMMFRNPSRIVQIRTYKDGNQYFSILDFASHSAARKTLDGIKFWERNSIFWLNTDEEVVSDAYEAKIKAQAEAQKQRELRNSDKKFQFKVLSPKKKEPVENTYANQEEQLKTLEQEEGPEKYEFSEQEGKFLLGMSLWKEINMERPYKKVQNSNKFQQI